MDMAGGVQDLAAFGASGRVKKLRLQPLGDTGECPGQNNFFGLKTNFPFHQLFSDLLLSGSNLERELEFEERKKEKSLGALKLGFAHVALAAQYNPCLASEFPQIACLTAVMGLEIFLSFPREKPSLTRQREREREKFGLRVPP
jgi:hypothetical protein